MPSYPSDDDKKSEPPYFKVPNDLLSVHGAALGPYAFMIFCALKMHANAKGQCWPSLARIRKLTGVSRRKVISSIKVLEQRGLIVKTSSNGATSNRYLIVFTGSSRAPGGAQGAPVGVHVVHQGGAQGAPKLDSGNQTKENQTQEPQGGGLENDFSSTSSKENEAKTLTTEYIQVSTNFNSSGKPAETSHKITPKLHDLLKTQTADAIRAEIHREGRSTSQYIHEFLKAFEQPRKGNRNGREFEYTE